MDEAIFLDACKHILMRNYLYFMIIRFLCLSIFNKEETWLLTLKESWYRSKSKKPTL